MNQSLEKNSTKPQETLQSLLIRNLPIVLQLLLVAMVVRLYTIEHQTFFIIFTMAIVGFVVNLILPTKYRLPFFALLSLSGVFVVFDIIDGLWLIGCGVVLISLCHLPVRFFFRVLALVLFGSLLATSRSGLILSPWSSSVWPILGSMFMFRLVLYVLATKDKRFDGNLWSSLAYFFLLPNLVFPLFPVVDYQTFRRTYYDKNETEIYEQGLSWIVRGVVHLLLYRFVYYNLLHDPVDVISLGDLVQYMLTTLLLYLRVSGQFHLIIGILHLFGFRLPETHKLYYLSHNFTELWRRINIYWTEFMKKAVFYPVYFKLKRLGPTKALVFSTIVVFVATWLLHSYQWFWLRGGFPVTSQDFGFWALLCLLVISSALKEMKTVKKSKPAGKVWDFELGLKSAITFCIFCFLWSLWSAHSFSEWIWMLYSAVNVDSKGLFLIILSFVVILILGGINWEVARALSSRRSSLILKPYMRVLPTLAFLIIIGQPIIQEIGPPEVAASLGSLSTTGLNKKDAALQHRGYYEQLDVRGQPAAQLLDVVDKKDKNWEGFSADSVIRDRDDFLLRDLHPSRTVSWGRNSFSTNQWGMRDRDYTVEKPPDTLRIALLGPSHVMGNGVPDDTTFEALVEKRLNSDYSHCDYKHFEILNFGVDGYPLVQQIAIMEDRVFDFSPDIIIATHYHDNLTMTQSYLMKVLWRNIPIPHPSINELLKSAGLANIERGNIPVPFPVGRNIAKQLGLQPRMPHGESVVRIRWIASDVLEWSLRKFSEDTRSRGIQPLVLGVDVVLDDIPPVFPNHLVIEELDLPVINLFDVFSGKDVTTLRVAAWDDHPNIEGHRLIAERLYMELVKFLDSYRAKTVPCFKKG